MNYFHRVTSKRARSLRVDRESQTCPREPARKARGLSSKRDRQVDPSDTKARSKRHLISESAVAENRACRFCSSNATNIGTFMVQRNSCWESWSGEISSQRASRIRRRSGCTLQVIALASCAVHAGPLPYSNVMFGLRHGDSPATLCLRVFANDLQPGLPCVQSGASGCFSAPSWCCCSVKSRPQMQPRASLRDADIGVAAKSTA
jgi:hypothetical protein